MRFRHIYILSIFFIILIGAKVTKSQPVSIDSYSFLNLQADTLVFNGQSKTQFDLFTQKFSQMIKLGNRQVNILHLGDSHLQADLYTGQVRKRFQSFMDGLQGARGMVTPFLKGSPDSYKITFSSSWHSINITSDNDRQHLGLWGVTAYTNAMDNTINVCVNNKNPIKYDFNRLRIYHSELSEGDNISLSDLGTAYQKIYNSQEGYTDFVLADYATELKISIKKVDSQTLYVYGFYFNSDDAGVVYNVSGVNGASALSYLKSDLLTSHIKSVQPDMIIVSLGTNDTYEPGGENTFEDNLSELIDRIKSVDNNIPILLISPLECYYHRKKVNPRSQKTAEITENVARKKGCLYLDMYNTMGGQSSCDKLARNSLMQADKVHMTVKGYQLQGDLLYNALWNAMEKIF